MRPPAQLLLLLHAGSHCATGSACSWLDKTDQVRMLTLTGRLVDKKNARRYDDCLLYSMVSAKKVGCQQALQMHSPVFST